MDLGEIKRLALQELQRAATFDEGYTSADIAELIDRPGAGVYAVLASLIRSGHARMDADGTFFAVQAKKKRPEAISVARVTSDDFASVPLPRVDPPLRAECSVLPELTKARQALMRAEKTAQSARRAADLWAAHVSGIRAYVQTLEATP